MTIEYSIISLILGLIFIVFIRHYDVWEPEPIIKMIVVSIFGGLLSIIFANIFYFIVHIFGLTLREEVVTAFTVIGPIEEMAKGLSFCVMYKWILKKQIEEPIDAIIYMSCIALGFSGVENVMYALKGDVSILAFRYVLATPAHILFSLPMAIPLSLGMRKSDSILSIIPYFALSSLLHGLWDALVFSLVYLSVFIVLISAMYMYARKMISASLLYSKFYPKIDSFFDEGNIVDTDKKCYCTNCDDTIVADVYKNITVTYARCPNCSLTILDRDNAFNVLHLLLATNDDLSKEYVASTKHPGYFTIRNCVFIDPYRNIGFVDIDRLKKAIKIKFKETKKITV